MMCDTRLRRLPIGLTFSQYVCLLAALICVLLSVATAQSLPRSGSFSRRRPTSKSTIEEVSEKAIVPDQIALAASRSDGSNGGGSRYHQRRGTSPRPKDTAPPPTADFTYGQLEMNLIRPESESPIQHTKISASYTSGSSSSSSSSNNNLISKSPSISSSIESVELDDSKTAAEYVANAMKLAYGTRHKSEQQSAPSPPQPPALPSLPPSSHSHHHISSPPQSQAILEAQMQAELQAQLEQQQALLLAAENSREIEASSSSPPSPQSASPSSPPAPVYEKEPLVHTRSFDIYDAIDDPTNGEGEDIAEIERQYRNKYHHQYHHQHHQQQQQQPSYHSLESQAEEKVRVSASTEIPKAEIMKQIEKSVIKYMKELQAEGKILTTPQEQPSQSSSKSYYKLIPLNSASSSSSSSSTIRPKHIPIKQQPLPSSSSSSAQRYQSETETAYQAPDLPTDAMAPNVEFIYKIKTRAPLQTATVKTVSKPYTLPLKGGAGSSSFDHGAALKNIEEFDLSHVVTNEPDQLHTHHLHHHHQQQQQQHQHQATSKPQKLYFNSDIYHDINALPYKGDKLSSGYRQKQQQQQSQLKAIGEIQHDYKGYTGYFAEPTHPIESELGTVVKSPSDLLNESPDDGYPIMNPYQYVLKKEPVPIPVKYEDDNWEQPNLRLKQNTGGGGGGNASYKGSSSGSSSLDYDSYSPKFNNNPEGYGYQHTYKAQLMRGNAAANGGGNKRGKRGNGSSSSSSQSGTTTVKKIIRTSGGSQGLSSGGGGGGGGGVAKLLKDIEANLSLRPPPKK